MLFHNSLHCFMLEGLLNNFICHSHKNKTKNYFGSEVNQNNKIEVAEEFLKSQGY